MPRIFFFNFLHSNIYYTTIFRNFMLQESFCANVSNDYLVLMLELRILVFFSVTENTLKISTNWDFKLLKIGLLVFP